MIFNRSKNRKTALLLWVPLCMAISFCARPTKKFDIDPESVTGKRFALPAQEPDKSILDRYLEKLADDPENPKLLRDVGTYYQVFSQPRNYEYVELAMAHLEKALEAMPEDPQTLIYLGLSKASYARSPKVPLFSKPAMAREAFFSMDHAVALDSENFCLRLIRAKAQLLAPAILGRTKTLKEDHLWMVERMNGPGLPEHYLMLGRIFLGDYEEKMQNNHAGALVYWRLVAESDSAFAPIAQARLKDDWSRF